MKLTLIFAGLLVAAAFAHPAAEDVHHVQEGEHHKTATNVQEREGERVTQLQANQPTRSEKIEILHPTVKCAEIVPDVGQAGPENHHACLAHCIQLGEYVHGRCLRGICQCGVQRKENVGTEEFRQRNGKGHPTVRCEHIIPTSGEAGPANHEACRAHCSSLGNEFSRGECFEGVCHCGIAKTPSVPHSPAVVTESVPKIRLSGVQPSAEGVHSHPTVRCEHLVPLKGIPSAESHELCLSHCRSLGNDYLHGKCVQGVCHCQRDHVAHQSPQETDEGHPTVKCEHIHPLTGHPGPENHEACSSHCHTIAELYLEGRCVAGICRCKPGTVVKAVPSTVHSPHDPVAVRRKIDESHIPS